jgi:SAM-dependent methyltransferase
MTKNPLRLIWRAARDRMLAQIEPVLAARLRQEIRADMQMELQALSSGGDVQDWRTPPVAPSLSSESPFMEHSTCAAVDLTHPRYLEICALIHEQPRWHRKQWEWVFIIHHLLASGLVTPGSRGLGFGVGREQLPALFASFGAEVVATDLPDDDMGWNETNEHSSSRDQLRAPWIVADADFDRLVTHRPADMNDIPLDLRGFDFTWSSCCYEHLGSLQAGMDFVVESVERLRPGGVAVHTTEYNVVSNEETLTEGPTVLYRRRDFETLVERLRSLGHHAKPFVVSPNTHLVDHYVDAPPYALPHMKLILAGHITTSAGIVVRRG